MNDYIAGFEEIGRNDVGRVGGKGANLGEMARVGFPMPPGFVITTDAFLAALEASGVRTQLQRAFVSCDGRDTPALVEASTRMRELVNGVTVPTPIRDAIARAYAKLGSGPVAVRSSATSEDTGATSFAGMHESYTNVVGPRATGGAAGRGSASRDNDLAGLGTGDAARGRRRHG